MSGWDWIGWLILFVAFQFAVAYGTKNYRKIEEEYDGIVRFYPRERRTPGPTEELEGKEEGEG